MAGKISELSVGAAVADADLFESVQGGVNVKQSGSALKTYASASPTLVTPTLGVAIGTSLALNGAAIGTNALAVTGTANISGNITGGASITGAAGGAFSLSGRGSLAAASDGVWRIRDNAGSSFGRLQFGGTTSSYPALKRSSTVLQAVLADDTGFCPLQGALRTAANAVTGLTAGVLAATTNASIVVTDASGQDYRIPCII